MTPASTTRKAKKLGLIAPTTRNLTPSECLELQEMQRLINGRSFEAAQIKANTALVPEGQKLAEQIGALANLLTNVKNQWVQQKLKECGYLAGTMCDINLTTGEIIPTTVNDASNNTATK